MEIIPKSFLIITLMLLFSFTLSAIISVSVNATAAEQYTCDAVALIEQYNFSDSVIDACKTNAKKQGYTMEVNTIDSDCDGFIDLAEVITGYDYTIKILNITNQKHYARAYAR